MSNENQELPDVWTDFDAAYKKACETSDPDSWLHAALMAQQVRRTIAAAPTTEPSKQAARVPDGVLTAIRHAGLTLLTTQHGYQLMKLGKAVAQSAPTTEPSKAEQADAPSLRELLLDVVGLSSHPELQLAASRELERMQQSASSGDAAAWWYQWVDDGVLNSAVTESRAEAFGEGGFNQRALTWQCGRAGGRASQHQSIARSP
ncbi:hypothetical protein [Hydrogenophaga sp.]